MNFRYKKRWPAIQTVWQAVRTKHKQTQVLIITIKKDYYFIIIALTFIHPDDIYTT